MATVTLLDCKIFLGGYNLSGYHNSIDVGYGAEMLDDTVFGTSGTRSSKPGLKTFEFNGSIFWDTTIDGVIFQRIGADREVMSFAPEGNAPGDRAYFIRAVNGTYNPLSGEVGALMASEFTGASANTPLVRGSVIIPPTPALTASGSSAIINFGAPVTLEQIVYGALHVTIPPEQLDTTITVTISSAPDAAMAAPTVRLTFTAAAVSGAQWLELVGPITDQYWRADWVIAGAAPSVNVFLVLGIQ